MTDKNLKVIIPEVIDRDGHTISGGSFESENDAPRPPFFFSTGHKPGFLTGLLALPVMLLFALFAIALMVLLLPLVLLAFFFGKKQFLKIYSARSVFKRPK